MMEPNKTRPEEDALILELSAMEPVNGVVPIFGQRGC